MCNNDQSDQRAWYICLLDSLRVGTSVAINAIFKKIWKRMHFRQIKVLKKFLIKRTIWEKVIVWIWCFLYLNVKMNVIIKVKTNIYLYILYIYKKITILFKNLMCILSFDQGLIHTQAGVNLNMKRTTASSDIKHSISTVSDVCVCVCVSIKMCVLMCDCVCVCVCDVWVCLGVCGFYKVCVCVSAFRCCEH